MIIINLLLFSLILFIFIETFVEIYKLDADELYYATLSSCFLTIFGFTQSHHQKDNAAWKYSVNAVLVILVLNICVIFALTQQSDAYTRNLAFFLVYLFVGALSCFYLLKGARVPKKLTVIGVFRSTLKFGVGLFPHQLMNFAVFNFDKVVLTILFSQSFTGIFFAYWQISAALLLIVEAANKAYVPYLFEKLSSKSLQLRQFLIFSVTFFVLGLTAWSISFDLQIRFFSIILPENYLEYIQLAPYFTLVQFLYALYLIFVNVLFFYEKAVNISLITFWSVLGFYIALILLQSDEHFAIVGYLVMAMLRLILTVHQSLSVLRKSYI